MIVTVTLPLPVDDRLLDAITVRFRSDVMRVGRELILNDVERDERERFVRLTFSN